MALPIWALYMKGNYENPDLGISLEDFEEPEGLTIRVDCNNTEEEEEEDLDELEDDLDDIDF